jgi:hypothetical protein
MHGIKVLKYCKCQGITRKDGARPTLPNLLPNFFCNIMCVSFSLFYVLFVCVYILYYCHRVPTQLQLNNNNNNNNIILKK